MGPLKAPPRGASRNRASVPARSPKIISGKARDKCLFPHHKVDEQPNKKPKKDYYSHKRRESDDKNNEAILKIVPLLGCVSQDSDALVSQRGKQSRGNPRCKKSWDPFEKYGSLSLHYVKRVFGKRQDHRWEKQMSKFLISEVPTL